MGFLDTEGVSHLWDKIKEYIGPAGPQGSPRPDGNPIGTIISFMGTAAPKDYLICDGAEYGVSEYPALAEFFRQQFGAANHFGGDGETVFAVPDLRNLFLRGFHGEAEERLSGEIGEKQEATEHLNIAGYNDELRWSNALASTTQMPVWEPGYRDSMVGAANSALRSNTAIKISPAYTSRPVNMAVLYCIKAVESAPDNTEEYDTEDGWYVRKWPDGYMEQTLKKEIYNAVATTSWGSGYNTGIGYGPYKYPEAFSKFYGVDISAMGNSAVLVTGYYKNYETSCLTETPAVGIYRPTPVPEGMDIYFCITVKGRWK